MSRFGRWWLILIILVALSILIWDYLQPKINIKDIEEKVSLAIKEGNFAKVARILEQAIQREPEYNIGRVELIQAYIVLEKYKEAQEQVDICLEKLGRDARLLFLQIHIWERQSQWEKAYPLYTEIAQKSPDFLEARIQHLARAIARRDQQIVDQNIDDLTKNYTEGLQNFFVPFQSLCFEWHRMQGRFAEAEKILVQLRDANPQSFDLHKEWLDIQEIQGNLPQASAYYQTQIQESQTADMKDMYQHLYVLTLPILDAISYSELMLSKTDNNTTWRMTMIDLNLRAGKFNRVIDYCRQLENLNANLEMRRQSWLGNAYFMDQKFDKAQEQADLICRNPNYNSMGLLIKINIDLAQKKYDIVQKNLAELLQSYRHKTDWDIKLQKERARYEIWQIRAYAEAEDWANVEKLAKILSAYPQGWSYSGQGEFWQATALLSQNRYPEAIDLFQKIAQNPCFPASLRIRAGIWHGIALDCADQDPCPVWQKYQAIPWKNFTTDAREAEYFDVLLGKKSPDTMNVRSHSPILANDFCLYLGLYYERADKKINAMEYYKQGLVYSFGNEFPSSLLQKRLEFLQKHE